MKWFKGHIGQRIKDLRKKAGYSQTQFGQLLDLSRVSVLNIESGRHQPPLFTIYTICCALQCEVSDIMPHIKPVVLKSKDIIIVKKIALKEMKPLVISTKPSEKDIAVNTLRKETGCAKSLAEKAVSSSKDFEKQMDYIQKQGPKF